MMIGDEQNMYERSYLIDAVLSNLDRALKIPSSPNTAIYEHLLKARMSVIRAQSDSKRLIERHRNDRG